MGKVTQHPSTRDLFYAAAQRWIDLKNRHGDNCRALWLGVMVSEFTDVELALIDDYLTGMDRIMLRRAGKLITPREPSR